MQFPKELERGLAFPLQTWIIPRNGAVSQEVFAQKEQVAWAQQPGARTTVRTRYTQKKMPGKESLGKETEGQIKDFKERSEAWLVYSEMA